ncbi:type I DNA topoisomerase [Nitrospina gracilis]|uniref:type I DNA topoisomerase n=1 Tax=Nitrospina gracilis TaxID=35801 RepID=UPI001EFFFE25|nr:type I DNA topoisomerase [Nitrospina gracilis]MCF8720506.1 DNA topoisomerase-1 [Nitrospina gracilis Nb-211]
MGKSLLIVESPTKVETLKKIIGKDFVVKASVGHIKDLPKKKLGVDVENNFNPEYITIRGKGKILNALKTAAKKADNIYLAPDPDREGEAIAHHICNEVSKITKGKIYRVMFNEITKKAVTEAIKHPTELNANKVNAQQARRILDRLVGYKISPILWKKVQRGLSAGRVQSVALRMICDREEEIKNFKSEEYWTITIDLEGSKEPEFQAKLFKVDGKKAEIGNEEQAQAIVKAVEKGEFVLEDIVKKERKRNPSAPFITSTLQQEASRKLNFSPKKTMMLAQRLYEGIALGKEGTVGLISYMRTDSTRLSDEAVGDIRRFIEDKYGKEYVPKAPNVYKSKKTAQEAHEAIRPTNIMLEPKAIKEYLEKDLYNLYELIWARTLSCQMVPAVLDTTQFDVKTDKYLFRANGSVIKFDGFMKVYVEDTDDEGAGMKSTEKILPDIKKGEVLMMKKVLPEQHFTQPPPRFTEAMLVKALEEKGIGRPSTYAAIISTIKDRDYIRNEDKRVVPTELGHLVSGLLVDNFPDIMTEEFTAQMEDQLDQIEEGKIEWVDTLKSFYGPFEKDLVEAEAKMKDIKSQVEETDEVCEKCNSPMIIKWGRFGKFMACSGYPECKNTKEIGGDNGESGKKVSEKVDDTCDKCGAQLVMKMGRFGKFLACSEYPECKFTKPISLGIKCPEPDCKGNISPRRTKKGRTFYGCSEYPNCKFTSWDKPVDEACPKCNNAYMVTKWKKNEGESIVCPGCGFKKSSDEAA